MESSSRTDNSFTARGRLVSAPNYNISKSGNVVTSKDLEKIMINNIKFTRVEVSLGYKDWNEYLQAKRG